jgi:hypothetical protein
MSKKQISPLRYEMTSEKGVVVLSAEGPLYRVLRSRFGQLGMLSS